MKKYLYCNILFAVLCLSVSQTFAMKTFVANLFSVGSQAPEGEDLLQLPMVSNEELAKMKSKAWVFTPPTKEELASLQLKKINVDVRPKPESVYVFFGKWITTLAGKKKNALKKKNSLARVDRKECFEELFKQYYVDKAFSPKEFALLCADLGIVKPTEKDLNKTRNKLKYIPRIDFKTTQLSQQSYEEYMAAARLLQSKQLVAQSQKSGWFFTKK